MQDQDQPPFTIAALFKNRWQVELLFMWIKQYLRIKKFLGRSERCENGILVHCVHLSCWVRVMLCRALAR